MRHIFAAGIASVLLIAAISAQAASATQPASLPQGKPGQIITIRFAQLKSYLEGTKDKAVLLNFWGTFCPPCIKEIPDLMKIQSAYQDQLHVVLVSMDDPADVPEAVKLLRELKVNAQTWHMAAEDQEKSLTLNPEFTDLVMPTTFLYDKSGKQVGHVVGKAHDYAGWEKFIKDHLK